MKLFVVVLLSALSMSTYAVNLAFKFDVTSSGSSMYACDAGLKHSKNGSRVCYDRRNPNRSCNPNLCDEGEACNCVCTGGDLAGNGSRDGEYRLDYFMVSHANWTDVGVAPQNVQSFQYTAGKNTFQRLFNDSTKFSKQLTALSFNLGSERYGAEWFVDICFRAPQIDYPGSFNNNDVLNNVLKAGVTITDIGTSQSSSNYSWDLDATDDVWYTGETYENLSGLKVQASLFCKDKSGNVINALNTTSPLTDFSGGQIKQLINKSSRADLKGCFFRFSFIETNITGIDSIRKWKKQKARICTYTSVNEPLE